MNIYAAGTDIPSFSTTNAYTDAAYWNNSSFRQGTIGGTSMASPQVCGVGALYLQADPQFNCPSYRKNYKKTLAVLKDETQWH